MAYISAEDVKHIRVALKKEFPQYKFSVTRDHHLGVNVNFMNGPRFAEFETRLRHERQMEGIKKAKEKGVYKGRKQTVDVAKIKELASEGLMKTEIAKRLGVGRATVYRALGD